MGSREIYQVVVEHQASFPYSVELKVGENVRTSDKTKKGWVWCLSRNGKGVWIPEKYLERRDHVGIMLIDYDSRELSAAAGERLAFIKEESGWVWCTNQTGQKGWIPSYKVRKLIPTS